MDVRKCFVSGFGQYGQILELDYSQLEIYVLAHLSGDSVLKSDLLLGKDLHGISAENLFGKGYTDAQRTLAKQLSFQLQYGAGAASMAKENGIHIDLAKKFIDNYFRRYEEVRKYHDWLLDSVAAHRTLSDKRTAVGIPAGVSTLVSSTGRRYTFTEKDAPEWMQKLGRITSFSPTEIKNYPVQGFATGDIVPMIAGRVYRELCTDPEWRKSFFMTGTVHDSLLFDCADYAIADAIAQRVKKIMESAPSILKSRYGIDFDLPLKVEAKCGPSWGEMEKLNV